MPVLGTLERKQAVYWLVCFCCPDWEAAEGRRPSENAENSGFGATAWDTGPTVRQGPGAVAGWLQPLLFPRCPSFLLKRSPRLGHETGL